MIADRKGSRLKAGLKTSPQYAKIQNLMTQDAQILVEFRNVGFSIGDAKILRGLNLRIARGETLVLLGESGCGKTTTLKMVNRLLTPTTGEVLVDDRSTAEWDPIKLRRRTGYVLQEAGLFPHFTVERNVALVPALEGWSADKMRYRTTQMLDLVGLDPEQFAGRFPHELSGGQRQRVGVARALASDPELLLLDEPFGALDPITRHNLQIEFAALVKRLNKTAIFVTHDLREALTLGSRIALMDKGGIVVLETPEEFVKSKDPLARAYLETIYATEGTENTERKE